MQLGSPLSNPLEPPEISVLLTCYNFRSYLREAVDSLLAQKTNRRFEVIVIDDASPDRSFEVLADILDPRLQLIVHAQNQGFASSISEGFAQSRGRYFCRWDGDDRWPPNALELLAQSLDAHPNSVVAYGHFSLLSAEGEVVEAPVTRTPGPLERDEFELLLFNHYTCAPAMMGRRSAWQQVMPWLQGRIDWFYNLKLAKLGYFVYLDQPLAFYRTHAQGYHVTSLRDGAAERHLELILREFSSEVDQSTIKRVTAHNYLQFALSYFGTQRETEARRCFKIVLRNAPRMLLNKRCLGPLLACFILGTQRYNVLKQGLKRRFFRSN